MAGEKLVTDPHFGKSTTYANIASWTEVSNGTTYYGVGHAAYIKGSSRSQGFVNNDFSMNLYYRTSNSGTWYSHQGSVTVTEGHEGIIDTHSPTNRSHLLRWKSVISIGGDGKANLVFLFTTEDAYGISHPSLPKGRGHKLGILTGGTTSPTWSVGAKMTTSHFITIKG